MSAPTCPNCGVGLRLRWADPELQRISDEVSALLLPVEEVEASTVYSREQVYQNARECPRCNGWCCICARHDKPTVAAVAGRGWLFDEHWLELA